MLKNRICPSGKSHNLLYRHKSGFCLWAVTQPLISMKKQNFSYELSPNFQMTFSILTDQKKEQWLNAFTLIRGLKFRMWQIYTVFSSKIVHPLQMKFHKTQVVYGKECGVLKSGNKIAEIKYVEVPLNRI